MKRTLDIAWAAIPWTLLLVLLLNLGGALRAISLGNHLAACEFTMGLFIAAVTLGLYAFAERAR